MDITEIEQKTFAELKADRQALTEAAEKVPVDVLASHYIRARMDATQRDEKLGEQGRTIALLQAAVETAQAKATKLSSDLDVVCEGSKRAEESARTRALKDEAALDSALKSYKQEATRANRLKAHADIAKAAVVQAAATLNGAVAKMQTEAADQGE